MRLIGLTIALVLLVVSAGPSMAAPSSYDEWWREATSQPESKVTDYSDFKLVQCCGGLTYYYFTKPNHPAYQGVIKRSWVNQDGATVSHIEGSSYASDAAQPAFKTWLDQISFLDAEARVALAGPSRDAKNLLLVDNDIGFSARCAVLATSSAETFERMVGVGGISSADASYVQPFAQLKVVATAEVDSRLAALGSKVSRADLFGAAMAAMAGLPGGSERVARACWLRYRIVAPPPAGAARS